MNNFQNKIPFIQYPLLNVVCERPLILDKDFLRYGRNTLLNFKKCNDRDCGHGSKHDLKSIPNSFFLSLLELGFHLLKHRTFFLINHIFWLLDMILSVLSISSEVLVLGSYALLAAA